MSIINKPDWVTAGQIAPSTGPNPADLLKSSITSAAGGAQSATANATVDTATVDPHIKKPFQDVQLSQNQIDAQNALDTAKAAFTAENAQGGDGKVSPELYNKEKAAASNYVDSKTFDDHFFNQFANKNNVYYNTDGADQARQTVQQVYNLVKDYYNLPEKGAQIGQKLKVPGAVGAEQQTGGAGPLSQASAYQDTIGNLAGDIRQIIQAGNQSGFRFNYNELQQISGLMPQATDTPQQANYRIDRLNELLKGSMGVDLNDFLAKDQKDQQAAAQAERQKKLQIAQQLK